ncbi:MAG TPA: response regulator transcription factor [Polyangia bacterium]
MLVVENHRTVSNALARSLASEPDLLVVAEAADGDEAVALARQHRPDVILMDLTLGDFNGVDATREIRAENPEVNVIALTHHRLDELVIAMFDAGAAGYLVKDRPLAEVVLAVRTVAAGQIYVCPQVAGALVRFGLGGPGEHPAQATVWDLSQRQRQVLQLIANGHAPKVIAAKLGLSLSTVETYRRHMMAKLHKGSLAELIKEAIRAKLVEL